MGKIPVSNNFQFQEWTNLMSTLTVLQTQPVNSDHETSHVAKIAEFYQISEDIVKIALNNLATGKAYLLAVSGKIGAGKDTIGPLLMDAFGVMDNSVHDFFARHLKSEVQKVIEIIRASNSYDQCIADMQREMNITKYMATYIAITLYDHVIENSELTSYSRTLQIRTATQYWGTEVRRAQDDDYWVKPSIRDSIKSLADGTSVYLTDGRFANEMNAVYDLGGTTVRLNLSEEEQSRRIRIRDNVEVTEKARSHPSELALDNYTKFNSVVFTDNLTPDEVVIEIMKELKNYDKSKQQFSTKQ